MKTNIKRIAVVAAIIALCYFAGYGAGKLIRAMMKPDKIAYPATEREGVADNYFGTTVADPYRWLEDDNSERTAAWVKAQNKTTFDYLDRLPARKAIRERLTQLWNYPTESAPVKRGEWYYVSRNSGLQNQSVLWRKRTADGKDEEVFLDPNTLSEDGTVALQSGAFTKDGRYFAYSLASAGSDWVKIYVMDTATKQLLPDSISWVKFSGVDWTRDGKGFYYSAYDAPTEGIYSAQNSNQKVF